MKKLSVWAVIMVSTLLITACGDNVATTDPTTTTTTPTTTTTTTPTTTTTTTPTIAYSISLATGIGAGTLSAGGTTSVTAQILANGVLDPSQAVSVAFTSSCAGAAPSKATIVSPAVTSAGVANTTYTDINCATTDTIMASASVNGLDVSASVTLDVAPAAVTSIAFDSASETLLGLNGLGTLPTTSLVKFLVKNLNGLPAGAGVPVTFSLSSPLATLSTTSATTDSNGLVSVNVTSGTVSGAVRVSASITTSIGTVSSQSTSIAITSGTPDQDSFTLATSAFNVEGWDYADATATLTVTLSDAFNNPVPDGTAVSFYTEGGTIGSSTQACTTVNGACSVVWTSANPKPTNGRVTILAVAQGDESFSESPTNTNYRYNDGETITEDLPEAWRDDNENGQVDDVFFLDIDGSGGHTPANTKYDGVLCDSTATNCDRTWIHVRGQIVLVMSESFFTITNYNAAVTAVTNSYNVNVDATKSGETHICGQAVAQAVGVIPKYKGQLPPAGTKVTAEVVDSAVATVTLTGGDTVLNSNADSCYKQAFTIKGVKTGTTDVQLKTVTPKGNVTFGPKITITVP